MTAKDLKKRGKRSGSNNFGTVNGNLITFMTRVLMIIKPDGL